MTDPKMVEVEGQIAASYQIGCYRPKDYQKEKKSDSYTIIAFSTDAGWTQHYIRKGQSIGITGTLIAPAGEPAIIAEHVEFLGKANRR